MEESTVDCVALKFCNPCGKFKSLDDFYRNPTGRNGLQACCKSCTNERSRQWAQDNPERKKQSNRISKRAARARDPEKISRQMKSSQLKTYYGISLEQFEEMEVRQNGLCAICGNPETKTIRGTVARLSVDHCHDSGKVRDLLCSRCNLTIGALDDDPSLLLRAATYLERHA
jgi:hypothetical protein